MILAFEANSALSCENETKIVKITHSVMAAWVYIFFNQTVILILKLKLRNIFLWYINVNIFSYLDQFKPHWIILLPNKISHFVTEWQILHVPMWLAFYHHFNESCWLLIEIQCVGSKDTISFIKTYNFFCKCVWLKLAIITNNNT